MSHLDAIAEALPGRSVETVAQDSGATWVRAGDFVVGAVFATAEQWADEIAAAYRLLDGEKVQSPITKQELWGLVLLVRLPRDREDLARQIAQDLRFSRKVPYLEGEAVPRLIGPFLSSTGESSPRTENPIEDALTDVARPEEKALLLAVLLGKDRRDRGDVDQLLDVLEKGRNHG